MENVIKELHSIVNDDAKAQIESKYPELFRVELESNIWYRGVSHNCIAFKTGKETGYGLTHEGDWLSVLTNKDNLTWAFRDLKDWQPATDEEVQSALIAECKKLGIWDVPVVCLWYKKSFSRPRSIPVFIDNRLWGEYGLLFDNGKFATPAAKKYTMAELESIVGHKFEII